MPLNLVPSLCLALCLYTTRRWRGPPGVGGTAPASWDEPGPGTRPWPALWQSGGAHSDSGRAAQTWRRPGVWPVGGGSDSLLSGADATDGGVAAGRAGGESFALYWGRRRTVAVTGSPAA